MIKLTITLDTDNETETNNVEMQVIGCWPTFDEGEWTGDEWILYSNPESPKKYVQDEIEALQRMKGCIVEVEEVDDYV